MTNNTDVYRPAYNWSFTFEAKGKVVGPDVEVALLHNGGVVESAIPPTGTNCDIPYHAWRYAFGPWTVASDFDDCVTGMADTWQIGVRPFGQPNWTIRDTFTLGELAPAGFCNGPPPHTGSGTEYAPNILVCPHMNGFDTFDDSEEAVTGAPKLEVVNVTSTTATLQLSATDESINGWDVQITNPNFYTGLTQFWGTNEHAGCEVNVINPRESRTFTIGVNERDLCRLDWVPDRLPCGRPYFFYVIPHNGVSWSNTVKARLLDCQ